MARFKFIVFLPLATALNTTPAFSDRDATDSHGMELLATMDTFSIAVSDQVSGGCLTNPSALKDAAEVGLRRNGFGVEEAGAFTNDIEITALGDIISGGCAVNLSLDVARTVGVTVPYSDASSIYRKIYVFEGGSLLTGPKHGMQGRLSTKVKEIMDTLFLSISRARDYVAESDPSILENWKRRTEGAEQ